MLNIKKLEKTFERNLFLLLDTCYDIGKWLYILKNRYVDRIIVDNGKPKPYYRGKNSSAFQEYVDWVAVDEGYARWLSWFYTKPGENYKLINALDAYFQRKYRFSLDDIRNASMYLEKLVEINRIIAPGNEVHKVFTKSICSGRADRLLKGLTFDRSGKSLFKSPLIPLRGGYFVIAKWVFSLGMHFESWVRPAIESEEIYGIYSDFIGKTFEKYVKNRIRPLVGAIRSNIKITKEKYPTIKREFEVDIVAAKGNFVFLISCNGGKKELPKLQLSKMWAEFPEKEIRPRIRDNKKEIKEMIELYEVSNPAFEKKRILKKKILPKLEEK